NRQTGWIPGQTDPTNPNVPAQFDENGNPDPVFARPRSGEVVQLGRQGQHGGAPRSELGQK
ncbi:MAG: hypothetical protein OXI83_08900, partial [Gemmatimonadota bacterium]|nr:hypothetical protein [Gemmatimonadota bacterium]